jgi:N-acyl-D-amino-acid deacylase
MAKPYDTLIRGASVHDGLGSAPAYLDVAIDNDRIAAVGSLDGRSARLEIDATGLSLAPGFIDAHTHDDFAAIRHPDMTFKSRGGVTTCIVGNCGFGAAPYAEALTLFAGLTPGKSVPVYAGHAGYAGLLEANPPGVNIAVLAGHGTLRLAAIGRDNRAPESHELQHMKDALDEALAAGVFGLSSGLIYEPGRYAQTAELIELAVTMRDTGALYATHMRDEGGGLLQSVMEAIEIGEQARVAVQISHHKASGRDNWGLVADSLKLIESAQARGLDVHTDQYPYTAGSTTLKAVLENGAFTDNAGDGGIGTVTADDVVIASAPQHPQWEGCTIAALAREFKLAPREAAIRITEQAAGATAVIHMMSEDDVQMVMRHPSTMIGSDGIPTLDGKPHPRLYNTFARVIGHYSRELGLLDLPDAIYRMTGFTAMKFKLTDRGRIAEGAFADLVLFDAKAIIDQGTYDDPNRYPLGISDVFVNGQPAIRNGEPSGSRAGRVLRRPGT